MKRKIGVFEMILPAALNAAGVYALLTPADAPNASAFRVCGLLLLGYGCFATAKETGG